jgi:hypothetical protein
VELHLPAAPSPPMIQPSHRAARHRAARLAPPSLDLRGAWVRVCPAFAPRLAEGKVFKNRVHLDVRVGTGLGGEQRLAALEAEYARPVALGAVRVRLLRADGVNESCLVMQDVEGNEFCLD